MFTDESHFMKVVKFLVEFLLNVVIIESEKKDIAYMLKAIKQNNHVGQDVSN